MTLFSLTGAMESFFAMDTILAPVESPNLVQISFKSLDQLSILPATEFHRTPTTEPSLSRFQRPPSTVIRSRWSWIRQLHSPSSSLTTYNYCDCLVTTMMTSRCARPNRWVSLHKICCAQRVLRGRARTARQSTVDDRCDRTQTGVRIICLP